MSTIIPCGTKEKSDAAISVVPSRIATTADEKDSSKTQQHENNDDDDDGGDQKSGSNRMVEGMTNNVSSTSYQGTKQQDNFVPHRQSIATSPSLFVVGFNHAINKTHVQKLFSKIGKVERISGFMTTQNSQRRYCFVELDSIESAQKAMDILNGRMLLRERLVVQPATSNDDSSSSTKRTAAVKMNPAKERILLDQKIATLKKKIKESQSHDD